MELSVNIHRLDLFGIPDDGIAGDVVRVRKMLARLVEAESLSLAELQTARDIAKMSGGARAEAYLFLAAMFVSLHGGNTFLRPEKGTALLEAGGYIEPPEVGEYANADYCADVQGCWPDAVRAAESLLGGEIVLKRSDAVGACWFFQRNAVAVDAVSAGLSERADKQTVSAGLSPDELEDAIAFKDFELDDEQIKAVDAAASRMFTVVTGGPGTGKTTIVCAILRALIKRGLAPEDIALVAPTGRAAQRMGEALYNQCMNAKGLDDATRAQIEALNGCTIHSLLGGFPPNWKYTADNKLPLKLVVVDESSMVDIHLMRALVAALPSDCRLVLLGDKDQLPSVEAGAVLGDIVTGEDVPCVVRLEKSKRFTGVLAECAAAIKDGNIHKFIGSSQEITPDNTWLETFDVKGSGNTCFRYVLGGADRRAVSHEMLIQWAEHYGLLPGGRLVQLASDISLKDDPALTEGVNSPKARALFAALERSRILTVVRQGPFGLQGINDILVMKRFGGRMPVNPLEKPGVPVVVTRNTRERNLWNGDVGVTVEGKSGMMAMFPRGDKVVVCPVGLLPENELAYAMTVHKSQGSEFEDVMVVLPDDENPPLLNRQIIYTGVTRAKKCALIVGTQKALKVALERKLERDTGIQLF